MTPRITALVPVWNGAHEIHRLLDALAAQTLPRERFDVIVVDNGSTDGTADVVRRHPWVTLVGESRPGSYQARNTGLERVTTQYVAFTDADCIPRPEWLEAALGAAIADPGAGVIAGHVALFRESAEDSATCEAYEQLFSLQQEAYARDGRCATANWTSPTALLRELGGFDATLKSGGDFQMAQAVLRAGRRIAYCPQAVVDHPFRGKSQDIIRKTMRVVGGRWSIAREGGKSSTQIFRHVFLTNRRHINMALKSDLKPSMKLRVICLIASVAVASWAELGRLAFGGEPRRA